MRTTFFVHTSRFFSVALGVILFGLVGCGGDSDKNANANSPPVDPWTIDENHCVSDESSVSCETGYVWRSIVDPNDVCCLPSSELVRCVTFATMMPGDPEVWYRKISQLSECTDGQAYQFECSVPHDSTVPATCMCKRNGVEEKSFTLDPNELKWQSINPSWFFETHCNYLNVYHEKQGPIEKKKVDMTVAPFGCSDKRKIKSTQDSLADFASYCSGKALFETDLMVCMDDGAWGPLYYYSGDDPPDRPHVMRGSIVLLGAEKFDNSTDFHWVAYAFDPDGTGLRVDTHDRSLTPMENFISECKTIENTAFVLLTTANFYETAAMTGAACTLKRGTQLTQPTVRSFNDGNGNMSTMVTAPEINSICGWTSGYAKKASVVQLVLK